MNEKLKATVKVEITDRDLITILIGVVEANTKAMNRVAEAVLADANTSEHLAQRMDKLTTVITGAQRKIGGEIGAVIEKSKETLVKLEAEREEVRRAGS